MKRRHLVLALVLAGSAAAAFWLPTPATEVVQPAARVAPTGSSARPQFTRASLSEHSRLLRLAPRTAPDEDSSSPFKVPAWALPNPSAKLAAPAPTPIAEQAPQAPPAPFKVIGRYEESGQPAGIFLEHKQRTIVARGGDQLTPEWKLESVEGSRAVLQYLPLSQRQTLEWTSP